MYKIVNLLCPHSQESNEGYFMYSEMRGKRIFRKKEGNPQDDGKEVPDDSGSII